MNEAITNDQILDLAEKHLTLDFGDVLDFSRRLIALAAPMQPGAAADDARDAAKKVTNVADRLDEMADNVAAGSQAHSDLLAAATIWRKHLAPAAADDARDAATGLTMGMLREILVKHDRSLPLACADEILAAAKTAKTAKEQKA